MANDRYIAIVGSREGINRVRVEEFVDRLNPHRTIVVSGGAKGVDSWAVARAKELGIRTRVFPAQWEKHGKQAGFIRNKLIVQHSQDVVAFWDGKSKGTEHTIEYAIEMRKPVAIFSPHGNLVRWVDENGIIWEQDGEDKTRANYIPYGA